MIILDIEFFFNSDRSLLLVICAVAKVTRAIKMVLVIVLFKIAGSNVSLCDILDTENAKFLVRTACVLTPRSVPSRCSSTEKSSFKL